MDVENWLFDWFEKNTPAKKHEISKKLGENYFAAGIYDKAESILFETSQQSDRTRFKELDSLFKVGKKETVDLLGHIESKMITLENQRTQKQEREWVLQRRDGLVELFSFAQDSKEFEEARKKLTSLHPDLQDDIHTIIKYNNMI